MPNLRREANYVRHLITDTMPMAVKLIQAQPKCYEVYWAKDIRYAIRLPELLSNFLRQHP